MNINPTTKYRTPSFKAIKVADTSNTIGRVQTNIQLFKLGREDRPFLQKLAEKTNYKKLCPQLTEVLQKRWQKVFQYCITRAFESDNTTYIAIHNNKPCGILTYDRDGSVFELDGICSIPQENKKIPFTGQTLLYQLFKDAYEEQAKAIKLEAVTDGPFNVVKKYEKRGFKADPTSSGYIKMYCNKHRIAEQIKEFPFEIDYSACKPEKTNLEQYLD